MCQDFGVTPRRGDILFIRTGVITEWDGFTDEQKANYAAQKEPEHAGVEACIETLEWIWDSGISAVAGDAISWEVSFCALLNNLSHFLRPPPTIPGYLGLRQNAHQTNVLCGHRYFQRLEKCQFTSIYSVDGGFQSVRNVFALV